MPTNCRVSVAIHILAVIALGKGAPATSGYIAGSVNTNPVVIRRLLSALREAGVVDATKGAAGGFTLSRPASGITLRDIYQAVEPADPLPIPHVAGNPKCPVGAHVQALLTHVFAEAQIAMEERLSRTTLGEILAAIAQAETAARRA